MRIDLINYNYNYRYNNKVMTRPCSPSFKSETSYDTFNKTEFISPEHRLVNIINKTKKSGCDYVFSEELLSELRDKMVTRTIHSTKYEPSMGEHLQKQAIRFYLLKRLPNHTPYSISIIEETLSKRIKERLGKQFQAQKFNQKVRHNDKDTVKDRGEKNYYILLSTLYKHNSIKFIYEFLKIIINEEMEKYKANDIEKFIHEYYAFDKINPREFTYKIENVDNKSVARGYLNGEFFIEKYAKNPAIAKKKLFNEILKLNNTELDTNSQIRKIRMKYSKNPVTVDICEKTLKNTGFIGANDKLDPITDWRKIELLSRALDLSVKINDHYRFQILEYYGDSILNILVGRFLVEKNVPKEDTTHYYTLLVKNKTLAQNTLKTGLCKTLRNFEDKEITLKLFADAFEAFIAALYLSYPEDVVYNYLKPIFEEILLSAKSENEGSNESTNAE